MRAVRSMMSLQDRSAGRRSPKAHPRTVAALAALVLVLTACDIPGLGSQVDNAQPNTSTVADQRAAEHDGARSRPWRRRRRNKPITPKPTPTPTPAPPAGGGPGEQPEPEEPEAPNPPSSGVAHGVDVSAATAGHTGQLEKHPGGTISGDGVTLDHKDFTSPVVVTGDNVTIRNSRFSLGAYNVLQVGKGRNTVIEHNTINGGNRSLDSNGILVQGANTVTIRRNDISQHANGIRLMGSANIVENYIHDLIPDGGGPHRDNIEIYGGAKNSSIARNRIVHEASETSPLNFASWGAPIDSIRVERNFVDGGNCTITYDPYGHSYPTRVQFVGNVFGDNAWYKGCLFNFVGTSALPVLAGTSDAATHSANPRRYLWQNNTWGETGSSSKNGASIGVPTR